MDVDDACADGGPYVSAQPCPTGVPLAMFGGMLGLFGSAGLIIWIGSRIGKAAASVVALGWPVLFIALGYILTYAFQPPPGGESAQVWGWLIPGVLFWLMGGAPLAFGIWAWREARAGRAGHRLANQVTASIPDRPVVFGTRPAAPRSAEPERVEFVPGAWGAPRPASSAEPPAGRSDLVDDLIRLAELHEAGDLVALRGGLLVGRLAGAGGPS